MKGKKASKAKGDNVFKKMTPAQHKEVERDYAGEFERDHRLGRMAFEAKQGQETCPYPADSWEAEHWLLGWNDAYWQERGDEAYKQGQDIGEKELAMGPPFKTSFWREVEVLESWMDGILHAFCWTREPLFS